jgi:hypothetical protein
MRATNITGTMKTSLPHTSRIVGLKFQQESPFDIPFLKLASTFCLARTLMLRDLDISISQSRCYSWKEVGDTDEEGKLSAMSHLNNILHSRDCSGTIVRWGLGTVCSLVSGNSHYTIIDRAYVFPYPSRRPPWAQALSKISTIHTARS